MVVRTEAEFKEKIEEVIHWFEKQGVQVEPVEINTIEG